MLQVLYMWVIFVISIYNVAIVPFFCAVLPQEPIPTALLIANYSSDAVFLLFWLMNMIAMNTRCRWSPFRVDYSDNSHTFDKNNLKVTGALSALSRKHKTFADTAIEVVIQSASSPNNRMDRDSSNSNQSKHNHKLLHFVELIAILPYDGIVDILVQFNLMKPIYPTWVARVPRVLLLVPLLVEYVFHILL